MDISVKPTETSGPPPEPTRSRGFDQTGLVLQGGGALGAYQAGVYQALHEAGQEPNWLAGVSIGAINCAIIAGNPPSRRLERLEDFWNSITARDPFTLWPEGDAPRRIRNAFSALNAMLFGQPGFFQPNAASSWFAPRGSAMATSLYDTAPLRETLERLIDFDLLNNASEIRFAVGAVNIKTANFAYFDNATLNIGPEHIMASGALPPALPMVRVGEDYYWDGGLVSNTPLQHLLENCNSKNTLVFQVDLFSAIGDVPCDMPDVMSRSKDILYSSRTRFVTDNFARTRKLQQELCKALSLIPEADLTEPHRKRKATLQTLPQINILQLIYRHKTYESEAKDYEFSRLSMREHWRAGYEDTRNTLAQKSWLEVTNDDDGIQTHDIHRIEASG